MNYPSPLNHQQPANLSTSPRPAFASCARGLEALLQAELSGLGAQACQQNSGGVSFMADWPTLLKLNLWSRLAGRILMQVGRVTYNNEQSLYHAVKRLPWFEWFDVHRTLRVDINDLGTALPNLRFAQLRVKDAICDAFIDRMNQRPSVDTYLPDVRVVAALAHDDALIYLDLSGENLFKRGWREEKGEASLKENLAAGLWQFAWSLRYRQSQSDPAEIAQKLAAPQTEEASLQNEWSVQPPSLFDLPTHALCLLDPFCGSGTIPIEVANSLIDAAPGWQRQFGFAALKTMDSDKHQPSVWKSLKDEANTRREQGIERCLRLASEGRLRIIGHDITRKLIDIARENTERAGLGPLLTANIITFKPLDARQLQASGALSDNPGIHHEGVQHRIILTNPPYGQRLQAKGRGKDNHVDNTRQETLLPAQDEAYDATHQEQTDVEQAAYLALFRELGDQWKQHFTGWHAFVFSGDLQLKQALGLSPRRKIPLMNGGIECRLFYIPLSSGKYRPRSSSDAHSISGVISPHPESSD